MRTGKVMKCIVTMMLLCIGILPVMAQKNIDKVVKELEGRSDVSINSVTKRDPKTRKVISMTKTYSVRDAKMAGALRRAFEKDEEFAITAHMNMPKGRANAEDMNLYFVFYPVENEKHAYSLTCNKDGEMTLTIIIKQEKMPRHYSSMDFDFYFNDAVGSKQMAQLKSDVAEKVVKLNIDEKVKDVLGSLESDGVQLKDNGDLILEGNVIIDGEKAKKGIYQKNGRKLIVQ